MKPYIFSPGEPAPTFVCRTTINPNFHFDTVAGRYIVLCLFGSASIARNREVLDHFSKNHRSFFNDEIASFFGVSVDAGDESGKRVMERVPGYRTFWDFDYKVSTLYGALHKQGTPASPDEVVYRPFTLVLDPLLRIIAVIPIDDPKKHNDTFDDVVRSLPDLDHYAGVPITAPVLVLPRVLEPELCSTLIKLYNENGGEESGFMREKDGKTIGVYDHSFKRRQDYHIKDQALLKELQIRLRRRIVPEIFRAFQYRVTRAERYMVGCYDGDNGGGFFRAHRDNTTKGTAHRRFAVTINLNPDEYDGGDLRFPEFGSRTYRAPKGGACVFSCSLLHEATAVTRGKRYAFLPFLYDDAAAKIRDENLGFLSGENINLNAERS